MTPLPVVQGRGELTSDGALAGPAVDELDRRDIVAVEYVGQRIVVDAVTPHHRDGVVRQRHTVAPGRPPAHQDSDRRAGLAQRHEDGFGAPA